MRNAYAVAVVFCFVLSSGLAAQVVAGKPTESFNGKNVIANEVLVQFKAASAEKQGQMASAERLQSESLSIRDIEDSFQTEQVTPVGGAGWYLVHSRSLGVSALVKGIGSRGDVAFVEPNGVIVPALNSVAQYFAPYQWALKNTGQSISGPTGVYTGTVGADIKASQAWDLTTGFRTTVIAVIDPTGIDYTHPDLAPNIWSAPSSYMVTVGGVQYTCPAGSHGFQFVYPSQTQGPCDPFELSGNSHGTILAGIMGANGASSIGVAGINWSTSIIHIYGASDAEVINGIDFLIQTKNHFGAAANIRVINNSYLSTSGANPAVLQEINVANSNNMLFVAAAGNGGTSNDPPGGTFPANFGASPYNAPNVISVANTDNNDNLCEIECGVGGGGTPSSWGEQAVHLGAPGWAIASTLPGAAYNVSELYIADVSTGTSASSPYVAGTAALVLSRCADLNTAQLKQDLLDNVDFVSGLYGCNNPTGSHYCTITQGTTPSGQPGGGRLNAYKSVSACGYALTVSKSGTGSGTVTSSTSGTVSGNLAPINCGSACSAVFKSTTYGGPSVTLTATPAAGSGFTGWTGACSGTGTCAVSSTSTAQTVTATFGIQDFSLTASPTSQTTGQGGSAAYTATVSPLNGFSGVVALSVSGLPAGASGTFNPTSISGSGNSALTVTTSGSTPLGTYTLTVKGTSGSLVHTATVTLVVAHIFPLTISIAGTGRVSSPTGGINCASIVSNSCSYSIQAGATVVLTEGPYGFGGPPFNGWSGACTGKATTCTVVMNSAVAVGASF